MRQFLGVLLTTCRWQPCSQPGISNGFGTGSNKATADCHAATSQLKPMLQRSGPAWPTWFQGGCSC
jgi:hypothetical protein